VIVTWGTDFVGGLDFHLLNADKILKQETFFHGKYTLFIWGFGWHHRKSTYNGGISWIEKP
jgi:hypothetical protein